MAKSEYQPAPLFDTLVNLAQDDLFDETVASYQLNAEQTQDLACSRKFLLAYDGSNATFNSYRREIERLLHWSWHVALKSVLTLKREDIEAFVYFCQRPPENWIGLKQVSRFIYKEGLRQANPEWRPFALSLSKKDKRHGKEINSSQYQLSQQGVQAVFSVLSTFYNFLIQEDLAQANPVMQIRQKSKFVRKVQHATPIRRLSELQWHYVIDSIEALAAEDSKHERSLFILSALYGMYLRISELAASPRWTPTMGDFHCDADGNWWFTTVGKGNKQRDISVSDSMLDALKRYRQSMGFSPLPAPGDNFPLLPNARTQAAISDTRHIRRIVQSCFDAAIDKMKQDGFLQDAEMLESATVHWLRHTGISDDVKSRPREHVRDDAGHSSGAITDRYIDVEMRERHASKRQKLVKP